MLKSWLAVPIQVLKEVSKMAMRVMPQNYNNSPDNNYRAIKLRNRLRNMDFKFEFYDTISELPVCENLANVAIHISDIAFRDMAECRGCKQNILVSIADLLLTDTKHRSSICIVVGRTTNQPQVSVWLSPNESDLMFTAKSGGAFYKIMDHIHIPNFDLQNLYNAKERQLTGILNSIDSDGLQYKRLLFGE